jgi:hypothetical protein
MKLLLGIVAAVVTAAAIVSLVIAASPFLETFPGAPAAPAPFTSANWDVIVHSDSQQYNPMLAGHGPDCAAPPATHSATEYPQGVFICRDHLMTAIRGDNYGTIYFAPNQLADFSTEVVITFDVSTIRTSDRDWWDLWVTPFADNLILPLDDGNGPVDLRGAPRNAVNIRQTTCGPARPCSFFTGQVTRNFFSTDLPRSDTGYETALTPSAQIRSTFELRLSRTRVKFSIINLSLLDPANVGQITTLTWIDAPIADLGYSQGVVQFGHHSYAPYKACEPGNDPAVNNCAGTFHWGNISISQAVPFTILRGDSPEGGPRTVIFPAAPANAFLRFAARGLTSPTVSFNGAAPVAAVVQPSTDSHDPATEDSYHDINYWMPVPAGTTTVTFNGSPQVGTGSPPLFHGPAFWSLAAPR